ncbi:MAG: hypothetical protein F8N37_23475 [Telmatospirillum sp.]|nr:hypothetical protein [Telmatospirillum sp.]
MIPGGIASATGRPIPGGGRATARPAACLAGRSHRRARRPRIAGGPARFFSPFQLPGGSGRDDQRTPPSIFATGPVLSGDGKRLTPREQQVMQLIGQGLRGREIARQLGMAYFTLRQHRLNILGKLGLSTAAQLSAVAAAMAAPVREPDSDS